MATRDTTRDEELERALNALSVKELEGVLDALTLVAESWEPPIPTRGLYLKPPHGALIASGDQKCIVKPRPYELVGDWLLVSGKEAYGVMTIGRPSLVDTKEFDSRRDEHCISRANRRRWWPERNHLYLYPVEKFKAYDVPRGVHVRPGVQTVIDEVKFTKEHAHEHALRVRILSTEQEAEKGFSERREIDEDEGILIPMSPDRGIWMKNTYVPLGLAFLNADYKVLSLVDLAPEDETVYLGPDSTAWALEASPAWFKSVALEVGDQIAGLPVLVASASSKSRAVDDTAIVLAATEDEILYGVELE
jgi:uncharacterized membrane protein (UPF0127 family)